MTLDRGRIRLGDTALVYLERTLAPPAPLPPGVVPRSYGLAPTAVSGPDDVIASVAPGEAVWLGFRAVDPDSPAVLRVRTEGPAPLDAVTGGPWDEALAEAPRNHLTCPPDYCLPGLAGPAGQVPFGVGRLTVFAYGAGAARVAINLVRPPEFARLTGVQPEPLDPDSSYKGWRLP